MTRLTKSCKRCFFKLAVEVYPETNTTISNEVMEFLDKKFREHFEKDHKDES